METIGFVGLGNMGSGMATSIVNAGYPTIVYDLRAELVDSMVAAGADAATSVGDLANRSDVILTSLPGPTQVEAVATGPGGLLEAVRPGAVWIDLTTSRASLIRRLEQRFRARGVHVLDAPVSGGTTAAAKGTLAIMVGGDPAVFERVRSVLETIGSTVVLVGAIGAGTVTKLVHNMISQSVRQAIVEGLTLGVKAGVDAELLWRCICNGAVGRHSVLKERLPRTLFRGTFEPPSFALELAHKDLMLAIELARELDVPMPVAAVVEQMSTEAMGRGWGHLDTNVTATLQEEAAGVEVRAPHAVPD